jgi:hypothetical protein
MKLKIEHTIRRVGGTLINMPPSTKSPRGKDYQFGPTKESDDAHICECADTTHIQMFLKIPTFIMFDPDAAPDGDEDDDDTSLTDSTLITHPGDNAAASKGIGGEEGEGLTPKTPKEATKTEPKPEPDPGTELDVLTEFNVKNLSDEELALAHFELLETKPHHNSKRQTIEAAVVAQLQLMDKEVEDAKALANEANGTSE